MQVDAIADRVGPEDRREAGPGVVTPGGGPRQLAQDHGIVGGAHRDIVMTIDGGREVDAPV